MHYSTLGNVLHVAGRQHRQRDGELRRPAYASGGPSMGVANYAARVRESVAISTSQASREFDIFASAATEIITALPTLARCQVGGVAPTLFDAANTCHIEGISCLNRLSGHAGARRPLNRPSPRKHPGSGKRLAVASSGRGIHCE